MYGSYLIVNVMEDVLPKDVEDFRGNHEPSNAHPEAIRKRREGKGNDEIRDYR